MLLALPVSAPLEVLWKLLVDKIEHPQVYVPGVSEVKILEKDAQSTLREMTLPDYYCFRYRKTFRA